MTVKHIKEMNEAVFILRHFIDLSARLLPMLFTLDKKIDPTYQELRDKEKIIEVFKSYKFETETSRHLLESNILDLIKTCYLNIIYEVPSVNKQASLADFLN
jgi:hypothetical protein